MFNNLFIPQPVRNIIVLCKSTRYIWKGIRTLSKGKLEVPVLDGTAITVSLLRGDTKTAGSVMFLLGTGEILEEWTHKKSVNDLARSMVLNISRAWLLADGREVLVDTDQIKEGDFEDEGCRVPEEMEEKFKALPEEYSHLYLAIEKKLAAVICIEDPLREEAAQVVSSLREAGFSYHWLQKTYHLSELQKFFPKPPI